VIHHPKQMIATQHMELEPRPDGQVSAKAGNLYIPTYKTKKSLNCSAVFLISRVCTSVPPKQMGK